MKLAKAADLTVLVIGEDFDLSGEARSRSNLELPAEPAGAGAPRAGDRASPSSWCSPMAGRWQCRSWPKTRRRSSKPGCWASNRGNAVADVLFGKYSPAGRLPAAFPRATGAVPFNYAANATGRPADPDLAKDTVRYHDLPITPLFPFGHGLSYSEFRYSDLTQSVQSLGPGERIDISITIENTGGVPSDEVVQLYVRDPVASIARPVLELRGFKRVELGAGTAQARHLQPDARAVRVLEPARPVADRSWSHRLLDRRVVGGPARQWFVRDHENTHGLRAGGGAAHTGHRLRQLTRGLHEEVVSAAADVGCCSDPPAPNRLRRRTPPPAPTKIEDARIDRWDPAMDAIVPKDWKIEKLAEGFGWAEGPIC